MLRRKPSKIEVKVEDKEELEGARKSTSTSTTTTSATSTPTASTTLLHHFDRAKDPSAKPQRIGLSS